MNGYNGQNWKDTMITFKNGVCAVKVLNALSKSSTMQFVSHLDSFFVGVNKIVI